MKQRGLGFWRLVLASLRYHRRTNLGVVLGVAVAAAVLIGALGVGDSVAGSLRAQALARIGALELVLPGNDRFFRAALADELAAGWDGAALAPAVLVRGVAATPDGTRRANGVQVLGLDRRFFAVAGARREAPPRGEVLVNERLARALDLAAGDALVLRVDRPSAMPRDIAMASSDDQLVALRARVAGVLGKDELGDFSLLADQIPPYGLFVSLEWLQSQLELDGRANVLAVSGVSGAEAVARGDALLAERGTLGDLELAVEALPERGVAELTSGRVFLDAPVGDALRELELYVLGVLTYFVNTLAVGERETPYSLVAAVGPLTDVTLGAEPPVGMRSDAVLPADLGADEVVLSDWLAEDLAAARGDELSIAYFVAGPNRRLVEEQRTLRVRGAVPIAGFAADPALMPEFPGLETENCRDWDPGVAIDLERIRDRDETYWDEHRGTPKAFLPLATGQELWGNRFGSLTAARVALADEARFTDALRAALDPAALGLSFRDVRGPALAASASPTDFGGLFLGLSFFLIVAALLLIALFFSFGVEQRSVELGTLLALGFPARTVRRLFLAEAALLALQGTALGAWLGTLYTRALLAGLAGRWSEAVALAEIEYHARPASLLLGGALSILAVLAAVGLVLRASLRRPAVRLLAGAGGSEQGARGLGRVRTRVWAGVGLACALGAAAVAVSADTASASSAAGAFFGAGALVLVAGIAATRVLFARLARGAAPARSLARLALTNAVRRPGRSLTTVALFAGGAFVVVAVGANRLGPVRDAGRRDSGTGGFAFFGQSTAPVLADLNAAEGRERFGLDDEVLAEVSVVPLRVRAGDEASCLNLNAPQTPRLLGVRSAELAERGAFRFVRTLALPGPELESPWALLDADLGPDVVPAIADDAAATWTLKKKVGDDLVYADERGRPFTVRLVATVADSILQGNLVIAEDRFEERFPSESGYRAFLVDAPAERADEVSRELVRALTDHGLELEPTGARLEAFHSVQNAYLLIFQTLGGLGLLLGTAGLGMVVLRNTLERRGELAVARAVGYPKRAVRLLVGGEHAALVLAGLVCGSLAALVAIVPALFASVGDASFGLAGALVAASLVCALGWVALASAWALRGALIDALRNE